MLPTLASPARPADPIAVRPGADWRAVVAAAPGAVRSWAGDMVHAVATPRQWSLRWASFGVLAVLYVVLSILIVVPGTPVLHFDSWLVDLHLWHKHPSWYGPISFVVGFGQRWIMTYILQVIFVWAAFRARSIRPLVLFAAAILLLNLSVGTVKYALGRIGPIHVNNAHDIFQLGGNIFPSGHVSNTVVLYGVLAWAVPRYRKALATFAVLIAVGVGLGTVFMRTHWFSDVVGGWIAGSMVLLALPSILPAAQRFGDQLVVWLRGVVSTRPRLHRAAHAVIAFGERIIPPDPRYVSDAEVSRVDGGRQKWVLAHPASSRRG